MLRNLVTRNVEGISKISLLAANEAGEVSLLHSFFVTGSSACDYSASSLYALRGEIPTEGLPTVVRLEALHFAANSEFLGTARLEFTNHLNGVESALPRDLESEAHDVVAETDEGCRAVRSRGIAFVPRQTATVVLDGNPSPTVATVCCSAYEALLKEDQAFEGGLEWLQASFTAQADGAFRCRTYRDPTVVDISPNSFLSHVLDRHLREYFPGQFLPAATEAELERIRGGGDRTDEEAGYLTADSAGALLSAGGVAGEARGESGRRYERERESSGSGTDPGPRSLFRPRPCQRHRHRHRRHVAGRRSSATRRSPTRQSSGTGSRGGGSGRRGSTRRTSG